MTKSKLYIGVLTMIVALLSGCQTTYNKATISLERAGEATYCRVKGTSDEVVFIKNKSVHLCKSHIKQID